MQFWHRTWLRRLSLLAIVALLTVGLGGAASSQPGYTLTAPAANSSWLAGTTMTIQWTGGPPATPVKLVLGDVPSWTTAATIGVNIPNTGSYTWTIPANLPTSTYLVYIEAMDQSTWHYGPHFTIQAVDTRPDLSIAKKPVDELLAGQNATYQLVVTNVGGGPTAGAITVTDTLGPGLSFVAATGSGWTCTASGQTVTCTQPGPLAAGQSLPPITLTAAVSPDVTVAENCAAVATRDDANPENDRTCIKGEVAPPPSGEVCGVKFADLDGNGIQDPGEPGLPGWTIEIKDAQGNVIAQVVTDEKGQFCVKGLPLGTYTVSEVNQAGWTQTYPGSGSYTVTLDGGQSIWKDLLFGNQRAEPAGTICGVKFHDLNGNGILDSGEPGLPGWSIEAKDAQGNLIAQVVTDRNGRFCFGDLRPGTYTFTEVLQTGWAQTYPAAPGIHTVSVVGGHNALAIDFGNRQKAEPCCLTFRLPAGQADGFSASGALEGAYPSLALLQALGLSTHAHFDATQMDRFFVHTFWLPAGNCLKSARLEIKAKPLGSNSLVANDTIALRFSGVPGSPMWSSYFGSGQPSAGLLSNPWFLTNYGGGHVFTLDLGSLPGGTNLLPWLQSQRFLDVAVQDDTAVDYMVLTLEFCECSAVAEPVPDTISVVAKTVVRLGLDSVDATVNGESRRMVAAAVVRDGSTLVPLRWIGEALGAEIQWDGSERRVTFLLGGRTVEIWIDQTRARLSGEETALPVAPTLIGGSTFVPVRFVSEALGADVNFDPADRSITIAYPR